MEKKDFIKEINFLNSYSKTTSEIIDAKYINDTNININTKKDSYINKTYLICQLRDMAKHMWF